MPTVKTVGVFFGARLRRFFHGHRPPGSPLLPSHPVTGKNVDFVHPRSMSW